MVDDDQSTGDRNSRYCRLNESDSDPLAASVASSSTIANTLFSTLPSLLHLATGDPSPLSSLHCLTT